MIRTQRAPLAAVFLTVAVQAVVLWVLLRDPGWADTVREASGGWIDSNLPAGALVFLLSVVPFVFVWGGLRPRDIGLEPGRLARGAIVVLLLWTTTQLLILLLALARDGSVSIAGYWSADGAPAGPLAYLLAMLLITTTVEEATYRGFVLPQLWLRLPGSPRVRTWGAVIGSAVLFALTHIPNRWLLQDLQGVGLAASLAALVVAGIFFAVIYLRTANLWVTGGIHALSNAPTSVVEPPIPVHLVLLPLVLLIVVLWPALPGGERRSLRSGTEIREVEG